MKLKSINGYIINKCNSVFIQDDDCHWYCIHEDDEDNFNKLLNSLIDSGYNSEILEEFENKFNIYMIGMDPNLYRKRYLE